MVDESSSNRKRKNTSSVAVAGKVDWAVRKLSSRASWQIAIWCGEAIHIFKREGKESKANKKQNSPLEKKKVALIIN